MRKPAMRDQANVVLIGAGIVLLPSVPAILGGQPIPFGELFVAVIYAGISAAVFWGLAVRRTPA